MKDGPFPPADMYGIKTAKICGLPLEIVHEAEQTYQKLVSAKRNAVDASGGAASAEERTAERKKRLLHHLLAFRYADLEPSGAFKCRELSTSAHEEMSF